MPLRRKPEPPASEPASPSRPGAKNRPTPRRRDVEAAQRRPLVPDGKAAKTGDKARRRQDRQRAREGMLRGDERYLGARDRGPMRRYLRDSVDSRWNVGEVLLPLMLVVLALSLVNHPAATIAVFAVAYGLILVGILDVVLLWRRVKRRVTAEFGQEPPKGSATYVAFRAFQMRMSRVPRPQVARGEAVTRRG